MRQKYEEDRRVETVQDLELSSDMKDLRERCLKILNDCIESDNIDVLESFVLEIRNEGLEEAANLARGHGKLWGENRGTHNPSTIPEEEIEKSIRALMTTTQKETK